MTPARRIAAQTPDPELPDLTIEDLGILRDVVEVGDTVTITITPTYSGCPAMAEIQHALRRRLADAGFQEVTVRTALAPPWTSDWITEEGRRKLHDLGIAPPGPAPQSSRPLLTLAPHSLIRCPRCAGESTEKLADFGSTPCRAQYRCLSCAEPFELLKAH